jgi:hypothetical protein
VIPRQIARKNGKLTFYLLILYTGQDSGFHGAAFENQAQITSFRCDVLIRGLERAFDQNFEPSRSRLVLLNPTKV